MSAFAFFFVFKNREAENFYYKNFKEEISNCSHDFKNAVAIYVENKLIGIVENESIVNDVLDNELAKYKKDTISVNFQEELKIVNGIYHISEILEKNELQEKLFKTTKLNLKENNIEHNLSNNDRILNVKYTIQKEKSISIPFKILENKIPDKPIGFKKIECIGKNGKELCIQEETYINDKLEKTTLLERKIIQEPIDKVILIGSQIQNKKLTWPLPFTKRITSKFGIRSGKFHKGIDIADANVINKKIVASHDGIIIFADVCRGYGNMVKIISNNKIKNYKKIVSLYAHCKKISVKNGQLVKAGQEIATVGCTGHSKGCHLHFELEIDGKNVDPINFI
jgi:murein DD-endopeptidase MepM/ murein hydrolase activator NlpD